MDKELEDGWRIEFEAHLLLNPYSKVSDIYMSENNPTEYANQATTRKWMWYLAACKAREQEIVNKECNCCGGSDADINKYTDKLKQEIESLKEQLRRERECVDFYASKDNWQDNDLYGFPSSIKDDEQFGDEFGESKHLTVGGRLARETQNKRQRILHEN